SRRRHTRFSRDWSSDVCSSDLQDVFQLALAFAQLLELLLDLDGFEPSELSQADFQDVLCLPVAQFEAGNQRCLGLLGGTDDGDRSEERRVGKECRDRAAAAESW